MNRRALLAAEAELLTNAIAEARTYLADRRALVPSARVPRVHDLAVAVVLLDDMRKDWLKALNRRAQVEETMLKVAAGKRPELTREECRTLALRLGTPADAPDS